jgi:transcriptional regulator with XRE-family HTH domain
MHLMHNPCMTLAQYMELAGLTDAQVAAAIGVHQTTAMRIRSGAVWPTPAVITKIAEWSKGAVTADDLHAAYSPERAEKRKNKQPQAAE